MITREITGLSARGLKPIAQLAADRDHGDRLRYMAGCRCDECRRANTSYEKARAAARKAGDWNGFVPADKAWKHLLKLSDEGVCRRAVQAVTDIGGSIISAIRSGAKKQIRARTERKILAVTKDQASDNALTSAEGTWKLLNKLLDKGYTKTQLAHALGGKSPALQVGQEQVTVRTAYEVRKLYEKCEKAGFTDASKHQLVEVLPTNTFRVKPGVLVHRMGD